MYEKNIRYEKLFLKDVGQNNAHNMQLHVCVCIHIMVHIIFIFIGIPLYAQTTCDSTQETDNKSGLRKGVL